MQKIWTINVFLFKFDRLDWFFLVPLGGSDIPKPGRLIKSEMSGEIITCL